MSHRLRIRLDIVYRDGKSKVGTLVSIGTSHVEEFFTDIRGLCKQIEHGAWAIGGATTSYAPLPALKEGIRIEGSQGMAVVHMTRYRFHGAVPYRAWPEMRHAAAALRRVARAHERGSAHTISAALVMMAFSVEAFCQTLGPIVLADVWEAEKRPAERWPVLQKLKEIGRRVGFPVSYGEAPWQEIKELFDARDRLAHARPEEGVFDRNIDVPNDVDPADYFYELREQEFQPLHNIDRLDQLAEVIDNALRPIWEAAGENPDHFVWLGMRHFSIGPPKEE